ncbi:hypothetical protein C8F04DRAFT_51891 [Mycena alexandri]|uniref:Uncharacterized protein n=1 Tax=Mycena alexandri TaxID=1745969 RepID=A0AAD6WXV1_9AGAR|nr:hypothetical protein C8F04DRAFT_51891 [Mycena alexandri]
MGKRKRPSEVPRALHSELSEYASLLRALSSKDTTDVVQTISQKRRKRLEESIPLTQVAGESAQEQPKNPEKKQRDIWTRWPMLVTDIQLPEFALHQELETLMHQCLRSTSDPSDDDSIPEDDSASCLPHLAESASNLLSSVLALIAHHTPTRGQSLQDRLNPLGWHAVLDMVASCGLVDATEISNVKARMEAIYGPYDSPAVARLETRAVGRSRVATALEEGDDLLLDFKRPGTRRPAKYVAEEDVDSDDLDS